jgi:hypothetical protein
MPDDEVSLIEYAVSEKQKANIATLDTCASHTQSGYFSEWNISLKTFVEWCESIAPTDGSLLFGAVRWFVKKTCPYGPASVDTELECGFLEKDEIRMRNR